MVEGFLTDLADRDGAFCDEVWSMILVDTTADKLNQAVATERGISQHLSQTISEFCSAEEIRVQFRCWRETRTIVRRVSSS